MLNFAVGPVQSSDAVREIGQEQVPYFRTPEFSELMFENERLVKDFAGAEENARVVFLTGSGTAAMEAAVMNVFTEKDKVLVVNGGSFGHRFAELCALHEVPYTEIRLNYGEPLTEEKLWSYGEGGPILGSLGFTGIIFAICGLVSGLSSFREKHILYTFSKAGSIISSVALVLWIFVVLLGVS